MTVVLAFPGQETFGNALAAQLDARCGRFDCHHFPDGESLVTVEEQVRGERVVIVASLRNPDAMALPLRFAAATLRELGAAGVGLVAPYLAYMRQDRRFAPGQAVSAPLFARFLEESFDWLVTVDPHLHRIHDLAEVFRKPATRVPAAAQVAAWIRAHVSDPLLIGPDSESRQWVEHIAGLAGAPFLVLQKTRRGDREVQVSAPVAAGMGGRNPVVVDDILSSGHTIVQTLRGLAGLGLPPAVVVGIHAVLAGDAFARIQAAGAARIATCDTLPHPSNGISVVGPVADACSALLRSAAATTTAAPA